MSVLYSHGNVKQKGSIAVDYHQYFKDATVAQWPAEGAQITSSEIHTILCQVMKERNKTAIG